MLDIGHDKHRLQPTQHPITAPLLGQLDGRARQVARIAFEFFFELLEQGEGIRHGAGKTGQHSPALERADLHGALLGDSVAHGDLTVSTNGDLPIAAHRKNGRRPNLRKWHIGEMYPIAYTDVLAAQDRLRPHLDPSPLRHYPLLDALVGHDIRVLVKHENHLPTGSFKVRNGTACITSLTPAEAALGVIAASTGNHGQGLAWAGAQLGVSVTICVPEGNNPEKNAAIRSYGATLLEVGARYDDAAHACATLAVEQRRTLVHSTNHREVLAGAGTMTAELLAQAPEVDAVVIALGGGSQAVGAVVAASSLKPSLEVFAVQSEGAPAQHDGWHDGHLRTGIAARTFAEGIATGSCYPLTFEALRLGLRDFVLVSEDAIAQSVRDLWRITHNLAEGSGATGLAGLRRLAPRLAGKTVAIILCGGNLDASRAAIIFNGGTPR